MPVSPVKKAMGKYLRPNVTSPKLWSLAMLSVPMGVATLLNSLLTNIPRYFIERFNGERELGVFAAMAYVMVLGVRVIAALGEPAIPRLARLYASQDMKSYKQLLYKLLLIGFAVGAIGIGAALTVGKEILTMLYKPEYAERQDVFVWLMVASGIYYLVILLQNSLTAARSFNVQPAMMLTAVVILLLVCAIAVPRYGMLGASVAFATGMLIQLVGFAYMNYKVLSGINA
jgi:O-antigen/teichoic acid export membrane protein